MTKKIIYLFILITIGMFIYFIMISYISESNIKEIKKNRLNYDSEISRKVADLEFLENDTNNVIEFNSGYNIEEKNKIRRNFWELFNKK
mgnify:CR=1 FL=1